MLLFHIRQKEGMKMKKMWAIFLSFLMVLPPFGSFASEDTAAIAPEGETEIFSNAEPATAQEAKLEKQPEGYYLISTAEQFLQISNDLAGEYWITEDITLPESFVPIGTGTADGTSLTSKAPFTGKLLGKKADGENAVLDVTIGSPEADYQGIFGFLDGTVQNITVRGSVTASKTAGGIAALANSSAVIEDCVNLASVTISASGNYVGGIVGYLRGKAVRCVNRGAISGVGVWGIGGVAGVIQYAGASLRNCVNEGTVTTTAYAPIGGVLGFGITDVTVAYCTNFGDVQGARWSAVGGLGAVIQGTVQYCYNAGNISGGSTTGGLLAYLQNSVVRNCFNAGNVTGGDSSAPSVGGVAGELGHSQSEKVNRLENTYNIGKVAAAGAGGKLGGVYAAVEGPVTGLKNNYYLMQNGLPTGGPSVPGFEDAIGADEDGLAELAGSVFKFDPDGWENSIADYDRYPFPTLHDNPYIPAIPYERPNLLSSAQMEGGFMEPAFDKNTRHYEIALPDDIQSIPQLTYTLEMPEKATASAVHAASFGETTVVTVTAADGRKKGYTFTLKSYTDMGITEDGTVLASKPVFTPDSLTGGQEIAAETTVTNKTSVTKEASLILVASRQNTVIAAKSSTEEAMKTGRTSLRASLTLPSDLTDVNVTAFVVNNRNEWKMLGEPSFFADAGAEDYTVSADPVSVSFRDPKKGILTVAGTLEKPEKNYILAMLYPGKTLESQGKLKDIFAVLSVIKTNEKGNYGAHIGVTGEKGDYLFLLMDPETGTFLPEKGYSFYFATLADRESMAKELYRKTSAAELEKEMDLANPLSACVKTLSLDNTPFLTGTMTAQGFCKVLYSMMQENKPAESEMLEQFTKDYPIALLIEKINLGQISDISVYRTELSLTEEVLSEYQKLSADQQKTISSVKLAGNAFVRVKDIGTALKEYTVLSVLNHAGNVNTMLRLIQQYADYLNLASDARSKYNNFSSVQKSKVAEKLLSGAYERAAAFADDFRTAVNTVAKGTGTTGGGGTGNGGSKNSGGVSITPTTPLNPSGPKLDDITGERKMAFRDLEGYDWAKEAISKLYQEKILSGVTETSFEPGRVVNREEFIKMAIELSGEKNAVSDLHFSDVKEEDWYAPYLKQAVAAGLTEGKADGSFGVGEGLTREDMAVIACRLLPKLGISVDGEAKAFADDSLISDYAKEAVSQLKALGLVSGVGDNRFEPQRFVTRAEAAQIIYNLFCKKPGGEKQ